MDEYKEPGIFTIMKIGYTLNGQFDPDHDDFKIWCNRVHIHRAMIWTVFFTILTAFILLILMFVHHDYDSISLLQNFSTLLAAFILGILIIFWKKYYKLLKVYLFYLVFEIIFYSAFIVYLIVMVIFLSKQSSDKLSPNMRLYKELSTLETVLMVTIKVCFCSWSFFITYIEYKYLKGKVKYQFF